MPDTTSLRLVYPQWQGAGRENTIGLFPNVDPEAARRAYTVGTRVLDAVLPAHSGPTEHVAIAMEESTDGTVNGIESRSAIEQGINVALAAIDRRQPRSILTLGGDCAVSVPPFTWLANAYGDDFAIVWIDAHPDVGTNRSDYPGFHAMALSAILGRSDAEIDALLPARVDPAQVAIAGLHDWTDDDYPHLADWGIATFGPDDLRQSSQPLLHWLATTGATKVAIHFDVDVIDSTEVELGLGLFPCGLKAHQARRIVDDLAAAADIVGLTIAEFIPRFCHQTAGYPPWHAVDR